VFTARYALSPSIKQICFVFKGLMLKILRGAHIAFMCFVRISEQTAWTATLQVAVHTLTADSTRYLITEDESKGTFSLKCISTSKSVTDYSPWRWLSRVETYRSFFTNKDCIYFGALVGEYYFCMIQCTDMEHVKSQNKIIALMTTWI
jgi:hypothetical protein